MKIITQNLFTIVLVILTALAPAWFLDAAEVKTMTVQELKDRLDEEGLVIIDVRLKPQWTKADSKIRGARFEDPTEWKSWMAHYPKDAHIVLYCA